MRLLLIGKRASITHWLEACAGALAAEGHVVEVGITRNPALAPALDAALVDPRFGAPRARRLAARAHRFSPDLILAIGAFHAPLPVLRALHDLPRRPPLVGWVGDVFDPAQWAAAEMLDLVAYTDSGLVDLHLRLGFSQPALYLPHAVDPREAGTPNAGPRDERMIFVANPTPHRRALVEALDAPIALYGPGWRRGGGAAHAIHARRLPARVLPGLYGRHAAALNVRNEHNVLVGLNQRNFQPCLAGAALVTDDQPDLPLCFEPGREVFVFRDAEDLNALYARLRREPALTERVAERGRRRVLADHTYGRRLETLAAAL